MRRLIIAHEFTIKSSLTLGEFDTTLTVNRKVIDGKDAFGNLQGELHRFCKNDKLFSMLGNFNGNRKKLIHGFKDDVVVDQNKTNEEFKSYVRKRPISELIVELAKEHGVVNKHLEKRLQDYGYNSTPLDNEDFSDLEVKARSNSKESQ